MPFAYYTRRKLQFLRELPPRMVTRKGVFSAEAAADYSKAIGREVKIEEIQPLVNELMASNLIMRRGHGLYGIADPFVQETWREKRQLLFND